jgi:hypothetical protein
MTKREKFLVSALLFLLLIIALFYFRAIEFSWLKVDMGVCQRYGTGIKMFNKVILEFPEASPCM